MPGEQYEAVNEGDVGISLLNESFVYFLHKVRYKPTTCFE